MPPNRFLFTGHWHRRDGSAVPTKMTGKSWPATVVVAIACCVAGLTGCAAFRPARSDEHVRRVELLALLQTLNADLLGHDSATQTLESWCADHRLAAPARITAARLRDVEKPVPDELRERLAIGAGEAVGYRHVQLRCGDRVLSEADNWYVPARLTAEMNRRLDTTDEPFGKVVGALRFQRRTLSAELLWSPLPSGWEMDAAARPAAALEIPHAVLRHRAILYSAAQVPFSAVVETYTSALFAFGEWAGYARQP